jgi:hypothetical protein
MAMIMGTIIRATIITPPIMRTITAGMAITTIITMRRRTG